MVSIGIIVLAISGKQKLYRPYVIGPIIQNA
jgi:hypothetical protein